MDTYRISTWDADEEGWHIERTGLSKWQVRSVLREFYRWGYTQISLLVEAETHDRPAKRWDRGFVSSTESPRSVKRALAAQFHSH